MSSAEQNAYVPIEKKIIDLINNNASHLILKGVQGSGKTYLANKITNKMAQSEHLVNFSPRYTYAEFIEDYRKIYINNQFVDKKIDGEFKAFCRQVVEKNNTDLEKKDKHFFIIDNINTIDTVQVFKELLLLVPKNKRGENYRIKSKYPDKVTYSLINKREIAEDCFKDGFYIPENVYILGLMNEAKNSRLCHADALNNLFTCVEIEIDRQVLSSALKLILKHNYKDELVDKIINLNKVIEEKGKAFGLNKNHFISQGYFADLPDIPLEDIYAYCWHSRLLPFIDYFIKENDEDEEEFFAQCEEAFLGE